MNTLHESPIVKRLINSPENTTSEMFAITFRLCTEMIITNRHVYGDKLCMDMITELNVVYMNEKIRRRL